MKKVFQGVLIFLSSYLCFTNSFSQVNYINQEWVSTSGTVGNISRTASVIDGSENLIVVSNTLNTNGTTDVLLTKYDVEGTQLWQQTYNGTGNGDDYGVQVICNASNEIFVAATLNSGQTNTDFGVLKYNASGVLQWASSWDGNANGYDVPADIKLDSSGNIYIVGGSEAVNSLSDYAVVKYNSSGILQWVNTYDYNSLHDAATSIEVEASTIAVTGASASSATNWDYATLFINISNGSTVSTQRTSVNGAGLDQALATATDVNNNIYITGYVETAGNKNIRTLKFDNTFNLVWTADYNGTYDDVAKSIDVDTYGNVYVAGYKGINTVEKDFITIKYSSTGNQVWERSYGVNQGVDTYGAEQLVIDNSEKVLVVGTVNNNGDNDFMTICYNLGGDLIFTESYDSNGANDEVSSIEISGDNFYITGTTDNGNSKTTKVVKYTKVEKTWTYINNTNGDPYYAERDLIVRIEPSELIMTAIDDKNFQVGLLDDFLTVSAVAEIELALKDVCGNDHCPITVYKIYRNLNSSVTTTISRLGDTIKVPDFWATLLFEFPDGVDINAAANALENTFPLVKFTDFNYVIELDQSPNDSSYNLQHSIRPNTAPSINVEEAWNYSTGLPHVKVGVYDTGIHWKHEDFGDGTINGTKVIDGWDFGTNSHLKNDSTLIPGDSQTHGTKCAGIIGAIRNNGKGIAGIAGGNDSTGVNLDSAGVSLYGMKILSPSPFLSTFIYVQEAIVYGTLDAINSDTVPFAFGLHIMSNSWALKAGGLWTNEENAFYIKEGVHFANRANVTFVASRGNKGTTEPHPPGTTDEDWVLCVGGIGSDGEFIDSTTNGEFTANSGWEVDVAAPANKDDVWTTSSGLSINNYTEFGGTSAAVPHVAGVAGLLMSYLNRDYPHYDNLAPEDVENIIQLSATDVGAIGVDSLTGYGRLNAGQALAQVDRWKYHVSHYDSDAISSVSTVSQLNTLDTNVRLDEPYLRQSDNVWFNDNDIYEIKTYEVKTTVTHNLPSTDTIVSYWTRNSSSTLFPLYEPGPNNAPHVNLLPREKVRLDSLNQTAAYFTGYIYEVKDNWGTSVGWWPFDTTAVLTNNTQMKVAYTILRYDPTIEEVPSLLEIENLEPNQIVSIYPNPTNENQVLVFNLPNASDVNIQLFDLNGKLINQIQRGRLQKGEQKFNIDMTHLPKGIYVYRVMINDKSYYGKSIKQ